MNKLRDVLFKLVKWLEIGIAVVLGIAIAVLAMRMVHDMWLQSYSTPPAVFLNDLLSKVFLLVIGVEFIKMIIEPTSENVLEVIMLTITRFLIIDHSSMVACLLGVCAIAVIFFIRKFLFCEIVEQGKNEKETKNNSTGITGAIVTRINKMAGNSKTDEESTPA